MSKIKSDQKSSDGQNAVPFCLNHTWENEKAHIARQNGVTRRCELGKMDCNDGEISILVKFYEPKKTKSDATNLLQSQKLEFPEQCRTTNAVSPLHLLQMHIMWLQDIALSDDEDQKHPELEREQTMLPRFEILNKDILSQKNRRKAVWMEKQIQNIQTLLSQVPIDRFSNVISDTIESDYDMTS